MEYKKVKSKKIYEVVADELLKMISTGELKPGDKLDSVQQLAENFHVGRSAIREALSALRAMGLVEIRQGEGTYIKAYHPESITQAVFAALLMTENDIKELLEVRKILEIGATRLAAMNRVEADLNKMEQALQEMREATGNEALGEEADIAFHMSIAHASHNSILHQLMGNVAEMISETMRETRRLWLFSKETTLERLYQEHLNIYEAIKAQDAGLAEKLIHYHLNQVEQVLTKYYIKKDDSSAPAL